MENQIHNRLFGKSSWMSRMHEWIAHNTVLRGLAFFKYIIFLWRNRKIEDHGHGASTEGCSGEVEVLIPFWFQNTTRSRLNLAVMVLLSSLQTWSCVWDKLEFVCWSAGVLGLLHSPVGTWLFLGGKTAVLKLF